MSETTLNRSDPPVASKSSDAPVSSETPSRPRCLVVDCGGVTNCGFQAAAAFARNMPKEIAGDEIERIWRQHWNLVKEDPHATETDFCAGISDDLNISNDLALQAAREIRASARRPHPHVIEIIKRIKSSGVILGMISNHVRFWFDDAAAGSGIDEIIPSELIVVSNEVGCSKPSARIFEIFLERLSELHPGVRPEDCFFIDDKPKNVTAAHSLGFKGVTYNAGKEEPGKLEESLRNAGFTFETGPGAP